jgi:hypothetical protein
MSASREEIINEIRKLAAMNNGQPPGRRLFRRRTNIHPAEWQGVYWAIWSDALKEAGFQPNLKTEKLDEELMLIKLAEACRHFEKFPSILELRLYRMSHREFPDVTTYVRHFGSPNFWPSHLALWAEKGGDLEVLRMVRDLRDLRSPVVHGVVYLLKSGANFKIGRSNDLMGRLKQLKTGINRTRWCWSIPLLPTTRPASKHTGIDDSRLVESKANGSSWIRPRFQHSGDAVFNSAARQRNLNETKGRCRRAAQARRQVFRFCFR